jgi:hypothetical protein
LAKFARVSREECEHALKVLMAPDPDSRSKEFEGRRIAEIDGGWILLNHDKYRAKLSEDERREYLRRKQQEYRHRAKMSTNVDNVSDMSTPYTQAEAAPAPDPEAQADPTRSRSSKASREDLTRDDGFERFWTAYPRKVGKGAANSEWLRIHPSSELQAQILAAVERQRTCDQWVKDGGQYVPHARTWLHQKRWEDEPDNRAPMLTSNPRTAGNLAALQRFAERKMP